MTPRPPDDRREVRVHPTAVLGAGAQLAEGVVVGPYAVIGAGARIGPGTRIGPHAVIEDGVRIGADNTISAGATLGTVPADRHFQGEPSFLEVGDRNLIREYVNISRATGEGELTVIGSECMILTGAHIGHNCRIGDRVVIVNACQLAGHVAVADGAYIGGLSGVLQFRHIGRLAMVGGYSAVRQDVPPFMLVEGHTARCRGLNRVGLQRQGISPADRAVLRSAFRILYQSGLGISAAVDRLRTDLGDHPLVAELITFLTGALDRGNGVVRWTRGPVEE